MRAEQAPSRNDGGNPAASPNNGKQRGDIWNISDKCSRSRAEAEEAHLYRALAELLRVRVKGAPSQIVAVYSWATSTTTRPAIRPRKMQIQSDEWRLPRHACSEIERCILRIGNGQN